MGRKKGIVPFTSVLIKLIQVILKIIKKQKRQEWEGEVAAKSRNIQVTILQCHPIEMIG